MFKKLRWKVGKRLERIAKVMTQSTEFPLQQQDLRPVLPPMPEFGVNLRQLLDHANIKCVDIGARGEGLSILKVIAPFVDYYACEPESAAHFELKNSTESRNWRSYNLFSDAIGTGKYGSVLHITKQPGLTSLLKPNNDVFSSYYCDDSFSVVETKQVNLINLDEAAKSNNFEDACLLKIDTQGSELDILESAEKLLASSVVGIFIEVEFQRFYVDQPLFRDIDKFMASHGFVLFDMIKSGLRRAKFNPNQYSRRQTVWAHALYLRDANLLKKHPEGLIKMSQLLALALAFEHYDYALEILDKGLSPALQNRHRAKNIRQDLDKFIDACTRISLSRMSPIQALNHSKKDKKPQGFG
jgi:FkbM family methyltransferase